MRSVDGMRRPRPLASTSASGEGPRTAKKASVSAGLGGTSEPTSERGHQTNRQTNAIKERVDSRREIIEEPNSSSLMGLSKPELIAYQEEIIDATNRGVIVKRLVNLISLLLVVITLALIAATFIGVSASGLFTYAK